LKMTQVNMNVTVCGTVAEAVKALG